MSRKKPPLAQPLLPVGGVSTFLVSRLPSPLGSLCDNFSLRVIPRSPPFFTGGRRGISHCVGNGQGEILRFQVRFGSDHRSPGFGPLPRLRDRNDSVGRVFTQTPGQRAPHSLATLSPTRQAVPSSGDLSPATRRDQALPLKAHDSPRSPGRRSS